MLNHTGGGYKINILNLGGLIFELNNIDINTYKMEDLLFIINNTYRFEYVHKLIISDFIYDNWNKTTRQNTTTIAQFISNNNIPHSDTNIDI